MAELADELMAEFFVGYPHLAQFTAEHVMQPGYDFGAEFEPGLQLVLDGLEAKLAAG